MPSDKPPCRKCGYLHPEEEECVWVMQRVISQLLLRAGEVAECRGCKATIYWIRTLNGKRIPYDEKGLNHFITCSKSADWRRPYQPVKKGAEV